MQDFRAIGADDVVAIAADAAEEGFECGEILCCTTVPGEDGAGRGDTGVVADSLSVRSREDGFDEKAVLASEGFGGGAGCEEAEGGAAGVFDGGALCFGSHVESGEGQV